MPDVCVGSLLSSRSNNHSLSTQLNNPWNHPVFCYIMCVRDLQRDSCGFSRYLLFSTDENNFGLDSEGLAAWKERRNPVKKHTVTLSLQTIYHC